MNKKTWAYLVAVALLGLFLAQAAGNLAAQSPVVDEPSHIARAMAYWRAGDLRLQLGHPPLIHALAGLPLLLEPGVPQPANLPGWQPLSREEFNGHALWDEGRPTDRIVFLARWPVLMLAMLLGALIFRWAGERFGLQAGVVALVLFAFDPNLLAHSALMTTDIGVTFFILLAVYSFDRWARRPSLRWLVASGLALGLACAAKFPTIILLPVLIVLALVAAWRAHRMRRAHRVRQTIIALAAMFAIGAVVVWAAYRFEVGPCKPLSISVPAPTLWNGLLRVKEREEEGRVAFLLGQISPRGWWYYFPVALAVKTPLPTLLLLGLAVVNSVILAFRPASRSNRGELGKKAWSTLTLMLLPVLYFCIGLRTKLNIGYRHLLPILPFLFIWVSDFRLQAFPSRTPVSRLLLGLLGIWLLAGSFSIYPYHLAYFNEIAGGPENGYRILADSNLDWGQDIKRLKTWLDMQGIGPAHLAVFTGSRPERYGIQALALPGPYSPPDAFGFRRFAPAPGVYVISASNWQGLRLDNPDTYDWFRRQTPVARIGYSLFVYNVSRPPADRWVAVCYSPDGPIDGDGLAAGLGRADMRSIFFDCRDGWVYLAGGGPGYYVVPARGDPTIAGAMMLGRATPVYYDRGDPTAPKDKPGFTLYRWDGQAQLQARLSSLSTPPGGAFDFEPATLVGYELEHGPLVVGRMVRLTTWWRANRPGQANLSQYAHLMSGDRLAANGERIGVQQPQMWQPGDLVVQQFSMRLPQTPGSYTLHVGLYLAPDGPRLPRQVEGQAGDEHPLLVALQVVNP